MRRKAVKNIRANTLSDYSGIKKNRAIKKKKCQIFQDSAMLARNQVFASNLLLCLKCSKSLILPFTVLHSLRVLC